MRHRTFFGGGYSRGGISENGGEANGPVEVPRLPEVMREAASKKYVDDSSRNLSASSFTIGTLNTNIFPAFQGDISKAASSAFVTLSPTGVTPGTYTKVTTDSKGRISVGSTLLATDIPEVDYNLVKQNAPTTALGYGILDALSNNGGVFNGPLFLGAGPTNPKDIVTKAFVDQEASSSARTGDVILFVDETTPAGFLRCNGGYVDANVYPTLYGIVGDQHNDVGTPPGFFTLPTWNSGLAGSTFYIKH